MNTRDVLIRKALYAGRHVGRHSNQHLLDYVSQMVFQFDRETIRGLRGSLGIGCKSHHVAFCEHDTDSLLFCCGPKSSRTFVRLSNLMNDVQAGRHEVMDNSADNDLSSYVAAIPTADDHPEPKPPTHAEFVPNDPRLLVTCEGHRVLLWDVARSKLLETYAYNEYSDAVDVTAKKSVVSSHLWMQRELSIGVTGRGSVYRATAMAVARARFNPDDSRLMVVATRPTVYAAGQRGRGTVRILDLRTGHHGQTVVDCATNNRALSTCVEWMPSIIQRQSILVGDSDGAVTAFDARHSDRPLYTVKDAEFRSLPTAQIVTNNLDVSTRSFINVIAGYAKDREQYNFSMAWYDLVNGVRRTSSARRTLVGSFDDDHTLTPCHVIRPHRSRGLAAMVTCTRTTQKVTAATVEEGVLIGSVVLTGQLVYPVAACFFSCRHAALIVVSMGGEILVACREMDVKLGRESDTEAGTTEQQPDEWD